MTKPIQRSEGESPHYFSVGSPTSKKEFYTSGLYKKELPELIQLLLKGKPSQVIPRRILPPSIAENDQVIDVDLLVQSFESDFLKGVSKENAEEIKSILKEVLQDDYTSFITSIYPVRFTDFPATLVTNYKQMKEDYGELEPETLMELKLHLLSVADKLKRVIEPISLLFASTIGINPVRLPPPPALEKEKIEDSESPEGSSTSLSISEDEGATSEEEVTEKEKSDEAKPHPLSDDDEALSPLLGRIIIPESTSEKKESKWYHSLNPKNWF